MYPAEFDYHRATSTDEALELLASHPDAKLLAGGHSLIPMMKLRLAQPPAVIDIGRVDELKGITAGEESLRIGSLTTHAELAASEELNAHCPILAEAAAKIADPQVRNKGTIGGNIAHADPASDLPAVLCALDAGITILGKGGERSLRAAEFFTGLLETNLGGDEILIGVKVPRLGADTGCAYLKVEHPASGYAVCGAAAVIAMEDGSCSAAALAFNGVTATPLVAAKVAAELLGAPAGDGDIDKAMAGLEVEDPLSDLHASGEYRAALALAYGKRALREARDRAG